MSSVVEDAYFQFWGKAGGVARLRRACSLFSNMREMLELQVRRDKPGLSDHELTRQLAKRLYFSDERAQSLLDQMPEPKVTIDDFPETTQRMLAILSELGVKFHVTGGVVSSYYGDPRFTRDLDVVIRLIAGQPETDAFLDRLGVGYFFDRHWLSRR
jgi:hypothetical protein